MNRKKKLNTYKELKNKFNTLKEFPNINIEIEELETNSAHNIDNNRITNVRLQKMKIDPIELDDESDKDSDSESDEDSSSDDESLHISDSDSD